MKQNRGVIKRSSLIVLVLFSILGLTAIFGCSNGGGGGGGGGGAGGGTPTSFTTATLFPLSSGWETDKWTLFVDMADYDINGVMTRAMADTQVTVDLDPGTEYIWRVRARRFDVYGELDTESRSDWTWFKTASGS